MKRPKPPVSKVAATSRSVRRITRSTIENTPMHSASLHKSAKKAAKTASKSTTKAAKKATSSASKLNLESFNRTNDEKRPTEIEVANLYFDPLNPRLIDHDHTGTQGSIFKLLQKEFDLQPLIDSMYSSGFFWEEPLVVVREPLAELKRERVLLVIEGNRRLAALKTILSNPDRYPLAENRRRLEKVPVIERGNREETLAFVGFRHITGIVPWESAAKASYAHTLVRGGNSLKEISQLIGDKTRDIARWVRTQSLVEHAIEMGLRPDDAERKFYFSYLLTSTDAPGTKRWLKIESDDNSGLVTSVDEAKLKQLWYWLFGSKSAEFSPVVPESRQIHKLNQVIANPRAVRELEKTNNLERALVEIKNPGEYVLEVFGDVRSLLQDLSAIIAGRGTLLSLSGDLAIVSEAKGEMQRIEKIIAETKSQLDI